MVAGFFLVRSVANSCGLATDDAHCQMDPVVWDFDTRDCPMIIGWARGEYLVDSHGVVLGWCGVCHGCWSWTGGCQLKGVVVQNIYRSQFIIYWEGPFDVGKLTIPCS